MTSISPRSSRIVTIDFVRGLIMVIMALDHVRDFTHYDAYLYDPLDATKTSVILYVTRWITHFCAPTFVLLTGVAASLLGKQRSKKQLFKFLLTRGLWLLIADLLIVSFSWSFNAPPHFMLFGVVAVIGVSMMILSLLIFLPNTIILIFGLIIVFFHNMLDNIHIANGTSLIWSQLHQQSLFVWGNHYNYVTGYPIIPWVGVVALGYCLGTLFQPEYEAAKRKKILRWIGLSAIILFFVLRYFNIYGNPTDWKHGENITASLMNFFNVLKYPPSLLYLLITLGPVLLLLSVLDSTRIRASNPLVIFGRVPLFYYIIHLYIIHLIATAIALATGHRFSDMVSDTFITGSEKLKGTYGVSLFWVYIIWMLLVIGLYPLCKWYANYKMRHKDWWWLSYL